MFWNYVSRGIKDDDICRVTKKTGKNSSTRQKFHSSMSAEGSM